MIFTETDLKGAFLVEPQPMVDERGFFARSWCQSEFAAQGLNAKLEQCSISFNNKKGTLRGMHFQKKPHGEAKLVRCTLGAIYDVIIDLRIESLTFKQWAGVELTADNHKMVYVPEGFAHGFLTLTDNSEIFYQISETYHQECAAGVRWDDPAFGVVWPGAVNTISGRDCTYPDFRP